MRYSATVFISYAPGSQRGRKLAERDEPTMAAVEAWLERLRPTWLAALEDGDPGFIALVVDDDGEPACTFEYGRDPDAPPIRTGRKTLRSMRRTTPTPTTKEEATK